MTAHPEVITFDEQMPQPGEVPDVEHYQQLFYWKDRLASE